MSFNDFINVPQRFKSTGTEFFIFSLTAHAADINQN
jgi:hypothetical protein